MRGSGLDNAGKTTIVKRIMGEDVNTVSPTLGFIIKTIDYGGWVDCLTVFSPNYLTKLILSRSYKLNICTSFSISIEDKWLTIARGRRGSKDTALILEELFWENRCSDMGSRFYGPTTNRRLPRRTSWITSGRGMNLWMYQSRQTCKSKKMLTYAAFGWRMPLDLCQQDRRWWLHGWAGNPHGTWCPRLL